MGDRLSIQSRFKRWVFPNHMIAGIKEWPISIRNLADYFKRRVKWCSWGSGLWGNETQSRMKRKDYEKVYSFGGSGLEKPSCQQSWEKRLQEKDNVEKEGKINAGCFLTWQFCHGYPLFLSIWDNMAFWSSSLQIFLVIHPLKEFCQLSAPHRFWTSSIFIIKLSS